MSTWHCSVVKGFGCSWLWPASIRLILMFGRGPRWGSKINIMFFFFLSGPYLPERHVGSWSQCANQHFINQYSKCILYYCITRLEQIMINSVLVDRSHKKIFPREGSACHLFFITHVYKTLKRTKSSPASWNQHFVYTRYLIHWSLYKKNKIKMHRTWKKQTKKTIYSYVCSLSLLIYIS